MDRTAMINKIGIDYHTANIEGGEYSYVKEAGTKEELVRKLGREVSHFKLDIRFEKDDMSLSTKVCKFFISPCF